MSVHIHDDALRVRRRWVESIKGSRGEFCDEVIRLEREIEAEIESTGTDALLNHLRLCGAIPEGYGHDSGEEKFYSKYTDILLSLTFSRMGMTSVVLTERSDAADVQCHATGYNFVADAKAFRLSRTAKNQKDFKVQAMHGWKRGNKFAMVVCPLYQMPARTSQIYWQAINVDVCLFSYSHLCVLSAVAEQRSKSESQELLHKIFKVIATLNPSKDATVYWQAINRTMLEFDGGIQQLWQIEKAASSEALVHAKEEGLMFYAEQRSRILAMSHKEAVRSLIHACKIDSREQHIKSLADNGLMEIK